MKVFLFLNAFCRFFCDRKESLENEISDGIYKQCFMYVLLYTQNLVIP